MDINNLTKEEGELSLDDVVQPPKVQVGNTSTYKGLALQYALISQDEGLMRAATEGVDESVIDQMNFAKENKEHQMFQEQVAELPAMVSETKDMFDKSLLVQAMSNGPERRSTTELFFDEVGRSEQLGPYEPYVPALEHWKDWDALQREVQKYSNYYGAQTGGLGDALWNLGRLILPVQTANMMEDVAEEVLGEDRWMVLEGSNEGDVKTYFNNMTNEEAKKFVGPVYEAAAESFWTDNPNELAMFMTLPTLFDGEELSTGWRWFMNLITPLEVLGVGRAAKVVRQVRNVSKAEEVSQISVYRQNFLSNDLGERNKAAIIKLRGAEDHMTGQSALSANAKAQEGSSEVSIALHEMALADETGDVSKATHNADRVDAIAGDLLPQNAHVGVRKKAVQLQHAADNLTAGLGREEVAAIKAAQLERIRNIAPDTLVARPEMSSVGSDKGLMAVDTSDGGFSVSVTYGGKDGGVKDVWGAIDELRYHHRDFGVDFDDFTVLKQTGEGLVPVTAKELKALRTLRHTENATSGRNAAKTPQEIKNYNARVKRVKENKKGRTPEQIEAQLQKLEDEFNADVASASKPTPKELGDAEVKGEYFIQVHNKWDGIDPRDTVHFQKKDSNWVFLDKFMMLAGNGSGSLMSHLLDAASRIHHDIFKGASRGEDRSSRMRKLLQDQAQGVVNGMRAFPDEEQALLTKFIKESNHNGTWDLSSISDTIKDSHRQWLGEFRHLQDTFYHLENLDLKKSLRQQGFGVFTGGVDDIIAKEWKGTIPNRVEVYDAELGKVRVAEKSEIEKVQADGGKLLKSRGETSVDGESVAYILSKETPESNLRAFREADQPLNYREGYYKVDYEGKVFIEDAATGRVLAVADTTAQANRVVALLRKQRHNEGKATDDDTFVSRPARNDDDINKDALWDLSEGEGRTSQRIRGERLQSEQTLTTGKMDSDHLADPIEVMYKQINQVSHKVGMRSWFTNTKSRFNTRFGFKEFPKSVNDITTDSAKGSRVLSEDEVAQARVLWDYVHSVEAGYNNLIEKASGIPFKALANAMGEIDFEIGEKLFRSLSNEYNPVSFANKSTSRLYLIWHPARQVIVQAHQALQLFALNPAAAPVAIKDAFVILTKMAAGKTDDMDDVSSVMAKHFKESGIPDSIDVQNYIRDTLSGHAEGRLSGNSNMIKEGFHKVEGAVAKVGFQSGELLNMASAYSFFYRRKLKQLGSLGVQDLEDIAAEARNFTYNMNRAGDMPYNRNSLNLFMRYLQVPHKAMSQMFTNRMLKPREKAQLIAFNLAAYGMSAKFMTEFFVENGIEIENEDARHALTYGLESLTFNWAVNSIDRMLGGKGENAISLESTTPTDAGSAISTVLDWMSAEGFIGAIQESPTGNLFYSSESRVWKKVGQAIDIFVGDSPLHKDQGLMSRILDGTIKLSEVTSGMNALQKSRLALEMKKSFSASGNITDAEVSKVEAIFMSLGLGTIDEEENRAVKGMVYDMKTEARDLAKSFSNHVKSYNGKLEGQALLDVSKIYLAQANTPAKKEAVFKELRKFRGSAYGGDFMYDTLRNSLQLTEDVSSAKELIRRLDIPEETANIYIESLSEIEGNE